MSTHVHINSIAFYAFTLLGAKDAMMEKPDRIPALVKLTFFQGRWLLNKYYKINISSKISKMTQENYQRDREREKKREWENIYIYIYIYYYQILRDEGKLLWRNWVDGEEQKENN